MIRKYISIQRAYWLFPLLMLSFSAQATLECGFETKFTENVSIPVVGPGISTVGEDVPVGKVLYRGDYSVPTLKTTYGCLITEYEPEAKVMNAYNRVEVASTPSGAPTSTGGKDIFPTNVPGIGVIIYITGSQPMSSTFPAVWDRSVDLNNGTGGLTFSLVQLSGVEIELVKTGPIAPGTQQVMSSSFPTFLISSGSNSPFPEHHVFVNLNFSGVTTMHTKTCKLENPDIKVDLGSHTVADIEGNVSVTPWKYFDIVLKECPPFYGYGNYAYDSGTVTGSSTKNNISFGFRSVHGVVDGNPSLAKLQDGPDAAEGIGIELSQKDSETSLLLDGTDGFSFSDLTTEENTTLIFPMKARYVRYSSELKPGDANGAVVYTITYQ